MPLLEVFAELLNSKSKTPLYTMIVADAYVKAISHSGNGFAVLHGVSLEDIQRYHPKLSIAIGRLRNNEKYFAAGYDGIYGNICFFNHAESDAKQKQLALF